MFEIIDSNFQYRVRVLKLKLIKRFKIKSDIESESESESEIYNIFNHKKIKDNKSEFNPVEYEIKN